jgi:molybdopterin synthase catalytic subunit
MLREVASHVCGGTVSFLGTVRSGGEDGPVRAIEYSVYEEMADAEFERIISEALSKWPDSRVTLSHRVGRVAAGEASVAVVAAAPHRADAFAACRYIIDETKKRVPIWKKEILEDGTERWREDAPDQDNPAWLSR